MDSRLMKSRNALDLLDVSANRLIEHENMRSIINRDRQQGN